MKMEEILTLLERFENSAVDEFRYTNDGETIEFKKHNKFDTVGVVAPPPQVAVPSAAVQQIPAVVEENESAESRGLEVVTSPIVGTFYRAPSPDSPPYAEEGKKIGAGETLCIIEAMKQMNELEAEYSMEIVTILVGNGDMVEYGQPLFEVKKA